MSQPPTQPISELTALREEMAVISRSSPTYAKLARYITDNYFSVIFLTAGELAQAVDVSQGSVSRFCSTLGYRGYNDFLRHLQGFVSAELTAPQRLKYSSSKTRAKSTLLLQMEHKNIDRLEVILESPAYQALAKDLASAPEVALVSARMSATLLPYLFYILNKMRPDVMMATPETPLWDTLPLRDPSRTKVFAVAFPRYPMVLLDKLEELKAQGFQVDAITDSRLSPVGKLAQVAVEVPLTHFSIFDIYSTPLLFINLLLRDVARDVPGLEARLEQIEKLEQARDTYHQVGAP